MNRDIASGLLQHNYFPRIAADGTELPPCFTSVGFTQQIAEQVVASVGSRPGGYDSVVARVTRFDLVARHLSIPHPRAYAELALFLAEHWDSELSHLTSSARSRLKPHVHDDGRIFSMHETRVKRLRQPVTASKQVKADVNTFYGSIYTHSLPWALLGFQEAKAQQRNRSLWANKLDELVRQTQRAETSGIAIGPGTSAIIGEILLQQVDSQLEDYAYTRYIDDFVCMASSDSEAQGFLRALASALSEFGLELNPRKTQIADLPVPSASSWVRQLLQFTRSMKPRRWSDVSALVDLAIDLTRADAEASSLRYALKVVEGSTKVKRKRVARELFETLLSLATPRPISIPFLARHLIRFREQIQLPYAGALNELIVFHAEQARTDAVTWLLYACLKLSVSVSDEAAAAVLSQRDCLALSLLSLSLTHRSQVVAVAEQIVRQPSDEFEPHRFWVLLYELRRAGLLSVEQGSADRVLIDHGVSFIDLEASTAILSAPRLPRGRSPFVPY